MNSEAAQNRQTAYDRTVAALRAVNPEAVPIAKLVEPFAIERVAQQVRDTEPPKLPPLSPEHMLVGRVSAMQNSCASLVADAKRKHIPVEWPAIKEGDDLGLRLQTLNEFHDKLESKIAYYNSTTQEQRAIDVLGNKVIRLEKKIAAMAQAMASVAELVPLLMEHAAKPRRGKKGAEHE